MKKLILLAFMATTFVSCERCYQCKYSQHTIIAPQVSGQITYVMTEFCGTKKEKEAFMKAGTNTAISGNVKVITITTCQ